MKVGEDAERDRGSGVTAVNGNLWSEEAMRTEWSLVLCFRRAW